MPEIYDISIDGMRQVQQADVDGLELIRKTYGRIRVARREATDLDEFLLVLDQIHERLVQDVQALREGANESA